jgi:hypothetical protein
MHAQDYKTRHRNYELRALLEVISRDADALLMNRQADTATPRRHALRDAASSAALKAPGPASLHFWDTNAWSS